jgi:pimeloyl-ACP methyl ester carboxylesterase
MPDRPFNLPAGGYVDINSRGRAWVWDTGQADRPTVVLVHGWTSTAALTWCKCFAPLGKKWRVVAMDLRGHGRGIRSGWPFTLEACADDLAALIEQLGVGPVVVAGYSMGGPVTQLLWQRHPERVGGLVLCATAASFPTSDLPDAAVLALGVGLPMALYAMPPTLRRELFRRYLRSQPRHLAMAPWAVEEAEAGEPINYLQAGAAINRFDASDWIGDVDVPTAVIVTGQDAVVPPERQRAMAAAITDAVILDVDGPHRACAETKAFPPALVKACRIVGTTRPLDRNSR